ncbi:MAG: hypothetical protein EXR79_11380 [Myxococcales bacterium]|nr:hypothetical protein [Myxococcales bacterium]
MTDTRVIKRYANRKMYDTARSCYVTLEEVADMVRAGADVRVIDNKTKEDLTEVTLTQALLDSERRNRGTVSLAGLRTLISHGAESLSKRMAEPVSRVREEAERTVTAWRDEAERTVSLWKTEAERRADWMLQRKARESGAEGGGGAAGGAATGQGVADLSPGREAAAQAAAAVEGPAPKLAAWVAETQRSVEELRHRIDDQIRHAVDGLGSHGPSERELDLLRRIERLEGRIQALEAARPPSR